MVRKILKVTVIWFVAGFLFSWSLNLFIPGYRPQHVFNWFDWITITIPFVISASLLPVFLIELFRSRISKKEKAK